MGPQFFLNSSGHIFVMGVVDYQAFSYYVTLRGKFQYMKFASGVACFFNCRGLSVTDSQGQFSIAVAEVSIIPGALQFTSSLYTIQIPEDSAVGKFFVINSYSYKT